MTDYREILRQYWGYPDFRGIQADIIESIGAGRDTLGLMPTGGGKSITFQVPALAMDGLCLVVTPLIALMKDQVANLRRRGLRAAAVYSGMTRQKILDTMDNAVFGAYKFLYISPERLATPLFMNKVRRMHVCLITVDEAHCISQWGYDFRPNYLRVAEVRRLLPGVPVLALTATATPAVADDIQERLEFRERNVFRMSFARKNLFYHVRRTDNKEAELLHILRSVPGTAIVYTRNRRGTRDIADLLRQEGISAQHFHAGLTSLDRDTRQRAWQEGDVRVMVATNAFGMGIDKPDVRLVVHMDAPDSLEAYFQEAGRAGRDGQTAYAVLLADGSETRILRARVPQTFPDRTYIRQVYTDLASFFQIAEGEAEGRTFDFNIERFCRVFHHFPVTMVSALQLLTRAGYIRFTTEDENSSRVMFLVKRDELYGLDYLDRTDEETLNALMRQHGGLFADYVPVEEDRLAEACGVSGQQMYESLCRLTRLRVINYVPHRDRPQITYVTRRVDACYVEISRDIYEVRRENYARRVESMVGYIGETDECRSRYLLRYFADEGTDCGGCDVCYARKAAGTFRSAASAGGLQRRCGEVMERLADGREHPVGTLFASAVPTGEREAVITRLVQEENIEINGSRVRLCRK